MRLSASLSAIIFCLGTNATLQAGEPLHSVKPEEWVTLHHVADVQHHGDAITASVCGPAPWLETARFDGVDAGAVDSIVIRMSSLSGGRLHFFWGNEEEPNFSDVRLARTELIPDGKIHEYVFRTAKMKNWEGKIVRIRVDPGAYAESFGDFRVESCELRSGDGVAVALPATEKVVKASEQKGGKVNSRLILANTPVSVSKTDPAFFSPNGMLLKDGNPTFVTGVADLPIVKSPFKAVAEAGFDYVVFPSVSKPLFESLRQYKLKALFAPRAAFDINASPEERLEKVKKIAPILKANEDVIIGYFSDDEPTWRNIPADAITAGHELIRRELPKRPIFINHAPRNTVAELVPYNLGADITGCDIYPIPAGNGHSDLPNQTISCVGDYVDKMFASAKPGQPVWMFLQAYHRGPKNVMPTFHESRFMAYNAILHGAQGVLYYGLRHLQWPNEMWPQLEKVGNELKTLNPVLVAPWSGEIDPAAKKEGLEIRHKRVDGQDYLFVANTTGTRVEWNWEVDLSQLHVLFENRTITKNEGGFQDTFEPYAVHIYSTTKLNESPAPVVEVNAQLAPIESTPAEWIWSKDHQKIENLTLYFRYPLRTPAEISSASILITADDDYRLYCNGKLVGEDIDGMKGGWSVAELYDLKPFLRPKGGNLIAVEVKNVSSWAGLIAEIKIDGKLVGVTDRKWRVSDLAEEGWNTDFSFEDSSWKLADSFGTPPGKPWGAFLIPNTKNANDPKGH